jgi:hypothetical protein
VSSTLRQVGTHAYNQWIYKKRRFAINDFTPVTLFSEQPMVLEARKDYAANTIPEFVALLKASSGKMQFGSAGAGTTTLACALLNSVIGVNVTHVPYRSSAPAANDLIGGQIDYLCGNLGAAAPLITGKQVKKTVTCNEEGVLARPQTVRLSRCLEIFGSRKHPYCEGVIVQIGTNRARTVRSSAFANLGHAGLKSWSATLDATSWLGSREGGRWNFNARVAQRQEQR